MRAPAALGDGSRPSSAVGATSLVPGERDLVEDPGAEPLGGASHRLAAERAGEGGGRLVVRQRPDHQAWQAALPEVAACGGKELASEAEALEFRPQVELVDLAVVVEAARAVAAVVGVAGDAFAEGEHCNPAALAGRAVPPLPAAPIDQLVELGPRDDALIRAPPGIVVSRRNRRRIGRLGAADFDQGRAHGEIEASSSAAFKSYV